MVEMDVTGYCDHAFYWPSIVPEEEATDEVAKIHSAFWKVAGRVGRNPVTKTVEARETSSFWDDLAEELGTKDERDKVELWVRPDLTKTDVFSVDRVAISVADALDMPLHYPRGEITHTCGIQEYRSEGLRLELTFESFDDVGELEKAIKESGVGRHIVAKEEGKRNIVIKIGEYNNERVKEIKDVRLLNHLEVMTIVEAVQDSELELEDAFIV